MADETKEIRINVRATDAERSRWMLAAKRGGRTLSQLIRWLLDRESAETVTTKKRKGGKNV